jgi:mannose-6-phosphate isomerase-like protein (cupin superfamily)
MKIRSLLLALLLSSPLQTWAQSAPRVEYHSATSLRDAVAGAAQAATHMAVTNGADRGAYNYVVVRRDQTGEVEVHERLDDVFVIQEGGAVLRYGGTVSGSRETGAGERRGGQIAGGTVQRLSVGDMMIVPAGVPHLVEVDPGGSVTYLVVKVITAAPTRAP